MMRLHHVANDDQKKLSELFCLSNQQLEHPALTSMDSAQHVDRF